MSEWCKHWMMGKQLSARIFWERGYYWYAARFGTLAVYQLNLLIFFMTNLADQRLLVGMGQISERRDGVIHEPLGIKKTSTKWLLKCLNVDQTPNWFCSIFSNIVIFFLKDLLLLMKLSYTTDLVTNQFVHWRHLGTRP